VKPDIGRLAMGQLRSQCNQPKEDPEFSAYGMHNARTDKRFNTMDQRLLSMIKIRLFYSS